MLDVGGTPYNWERIDARFPITLLNTRRPLEADGLDARYTLVQGSGTQLDFPDRSSFDIAFSNSVIEHVGSLDAQRAFAKELRQGRTAGVGADAGPGLSSSSRTFSGSFHHFLPTLLARRLVRNFTLWGWITRPSRASVDRMLGELRLLDYATFRELFSDCEIRRERFNGFTKAFVAVRIEARQSAVVRVIAIFQTDRPREESPRAQIARISSLTQYPIKSCGGRLEQAEIDTSGLRGDRLLVIDENGSSSARKSFRHGVDSEPRRRGVSAPGQALLDSCDLRANRGTKH